MAQYIIKDIKFAETSDFNFKIHFKYKGLILSTPDMARTISINDIKSTIISAVETTEQRRSDDNYATLKSNFDGKETLTLNG